MARSARLHRDAGHVDDLRQADTSMHYVLVNVTEEINEDFSSSEPALRPSAKDEERHDVMTISQWGIQRHGPGSA